MTKREIYNFAQQISSKSAKLHEDFNDIFSCYQECCARSPQSCLQSYYYTCKPYCPKDSVIYFCHRLSDLCTFCI